MRKTMRILLPAVLLLLLLCGCKNAAEAEWILDMPKPNPTLSAQPEVVSYPMTTTESINVMISGMEGMYPMLAQAEEYTGIHVNWQYASFQSYNDELMAAFASDDAPDMFYGYKWIGLYQFLDYGDEIAMDMTDAISRCAPNYLNEIKSNPVLTGTLFDGEYGEMFCFYQILEGSGTPTYGPYIRADWLEALGLEIPQTYDDYHNVLLAFKENYGCTQSFGMQPTGAISGDYLAAGYGVTAYTSGSDMATVGFYQENGKIKYGPAEDGFWEYAKMLHQWYEEGLFNSDYVLWSDVNTYEKLLITEEIGLLYTSTSRAPGLSKNLSGDGRLEPIPDAVKTTGDVTHLSNASNSVTGSATFTVFEKSTKVDTAVRWCDFWYTEKGKQLVNYGTTEQIAPEEINVANLCSLLPGVYDQKLSQMRMDETTRSMVDTWESNRDNSARLSSDLKMSEADQQKFGVLAQGLTTTVTIWLNKLIVGEESFDNREEFIKQLNEYGLPKCIDCLNAYALGEIPAQ